MFFAKFNIVEPPDFADAYLAENTLLEKSLERTYGSQMMDDDKWMNIKLINKNKNQTSSFSHLHAITYKSYVQRSYEKFSDRPGTL